MIRVSRFLLRGDELPICYVESGLGQRCPVPQLCQWVAHERESTVLTRYSLLFMLSRGKFVPGPKALLSSRETTLCFASYRFPGEVTNCRSNRSADQEQYE